MDILICTAANAASDKILTERMAGALPVNGRDARKGRDFCWSKVKRERGLQATYDGYGSGSMRALPVPTTDRRTRKYDADSEPFNRKSRIGTDRCAPKGQITSGGRTHSNS